MKLGKIVTFILFGFSISCSNKSKNKEAWAKLQGIQKQLLTSLIFSRLKLTYLEGILHLKSIRMLLLKT
jgi:hypothetical protein